MRVPKLAVTFFVPVALCAAIAPPVRTRVPLPRPFATIAPFSTTTPIGASALHRAESARFVGAVPAGARVPLSQLPPLPAKTAANSGRRLAKGSIRAMDATGATITVTASATDTDCVNTSGALFALNCTVYWQSSGLPGGDRYQDYYISATNGSDYTATATASGGTYTGTGGAQRNVSLNATGTWIFGTYDTTKAQWVTVVYIDVGQAFQIQVFQDSAHTQEVYQFDAAHSGAAYILVSNITASDTYVVYIEQTSLHPNCVYVSPAQSTPAGTGQLCNPSLSPGIGAPGGSLSVTWPLNSSDAAGAYSIVVYDLTIGQRLGQVQVGLIGSNNTALLVAPDGSGAGINPSPNPVPNNPPVNPAPQPYIAWDGTTDQSTTGISLNVTGLAGNSYTWSVSDPDGQVLGTSTATFSAPSGTYASHVFNFSTLGVLGAGYYPSPTFTASLYNKSQGVMVATTTFKILGYYSQTQFTTGSGTSQTLDVGAAGGSVAAALVLSNAGAVRYTTAYSDSFSGLEFSTGTDFTVTGGLAAGDGYGVLAVPNGHTLAQCQAAGGCSTTVTDSNGNLWSVTDWCSATGTTTQKRDAQCILLFTPSASGTVLAAGASITLGSVTFSTTANETCGTSCAGMAAELPTHGLAWSAIGTSAAPVYTASAPFYFATGTGYSGTASMVLYGNTNDGTGNQVEEHYFKTNTAHAAYIRPDPFNVDNSYFNEYAFTITNNSSQEITELAIGLPGTYGTLNEINYYSTPANGWTLDIPCPGTLFATKYVCLAAPYSRFFGYQGINPGDTETVYLYANAPTSSFSYTDWTVFAAEPVPFQMTPTGTATIPAGPSNPYTVDGLGFAMYSLDSTLMSATFEPSNVGRTLPTVDAVFQNTSLAEDANPDYVDAVVIQIPNGSVNAGPTLQSPPTGWTYEGTTGANPQYYWFGVCAGQRGNGNRSGPPGVTNGIGTYPLNGDAAALPTCSAAQEQNSLAPGAKLDARFTLQNVANGTNTFYMWAHGANGGGWSNKMTFSFNASSLSGNAGFASINGTAVPTNSEPSISADSNVYTYTATIPSNSGATSNSSFTITVPATDINGLTASQLGASPWAVSSVSIASQSGATTCAIGSVTNPSGSTNGSIVVSGCNFSNMGGSVTVQFTGASPSVQNDEFLFPTTITTGNGTTTAAETWAGDQRVQVEDMIGLSVVVDPNNPGPGGSTPVVNCPNCSFAGSTIDFGNVTNMTQTQYTDVARASVTAYASGHTNGWVLCMETDTNPASNHAGVSHELQALVDGAHSTSATGLSYGDSSYTDIPVAASGVSQLLLATGPFSTTRTTPYDVIQSYQLSMGTELAAGAVAQITYTLIEDTSSCPST